MLFKIYCQRDNSIFFFFRVIRIFELGPLSLGLIRRVQQIIPHVQIILHEIKSDLTFNDVKFMRTQFGSVLARMSVFPKLYFSFVAIISNTRIVLIEHANRNQLRLNSLYVLAYFSPVLKQI